MSDVARTILAFLVRGEAGSACAAARTWCGLTTANLEACTDEDLWMRLEEAVFTRAKSLERRREDGVPPADAPWLNFFRLCYEYHSIPKLLEIVREHPISLRLLEPRFLRNVEFLKAAFAEQVEEQAKNATSDYLQALLDCDSDDMEACAVWDFFVDECERDLTTRYRAVFATSDETYEMWSDAYAEELKRLVQKRIHDDPDWFGRGATP